MKPENIYRQIQMLYFVILIGLIFLGGVAYYFVLINGNMSLIDASTEKAISTLLIIMVFVGIPVSYMFHKKNVSHINTELPLTEKLKGYRKSMFIKLVTLEGLAMFSLIGYILAGNKSYLYIFLIVLIVYLLNYPAKSTIKQELSLDDGEMNF